ncbi:MAG: hypothetical protein ACKOAV_11875, partial [Bacteroidota bacterium]
MTQGGAACCINGYRWQWVNGNGNCIGNGNTGIGSHCYSVGTSGNYGVVGRGCTNDVHVISAPLVGSACAGIRAEHGVGALAERCC